MSAKDRMIGGDHYKRMGIEVWDVVDTWPLEQRIGAYRFGMLKYVMRMGNKDEMLQEIEKGNHYGEKLAEVLRGEQTPPLTEQEEQMMKGAYENAISKLFDIVLGPRHRVTARLETVQHTNMLELLDVVRQRHGLIVTKLVLREFGVDMEYDLQPFQYEHVIKLCNEILEGSV